MSTATFNSSNIAAAQPSTVGIALRELGVAAQRLAVALWASVTTRSVSRSSVLSASEEAQELRAFASSIAATDPSFADDLFAAADRHEFADNA